jgi:beta-phosphoglucomutase-like phosphatase (HAD superfamily)
LPGQYQRCPGGTSISRPLRLDPTHQLLRQPQNRASPRYETGPTQLDQAVAALDTEPSRCLFIGDTVTDVQAGHTTGTRVIALAKTAQLRAQLIAVRAPNVIDLGDGPALVSWLEAVDP